MNSKFLGTVFSRCMYAHPVCERTNELCTLPILLSKKRINTSKQYVPFQTET